MSLISQKLVIGGAAAAACGLAWCYLRRLQTVEVAADCLRRSFEDMLNRRLLAQARDTTRASRRMNEVSFDGRPEIHIEESHL